MPGNFQDVFSEIPVITYLTNLSCTSYFFSLAKPKQTKKSPLQQQQQKKKPKNSSWNRKKQILIYLTCKKSNASKIWLF